MSTTVKAHKAAVGYSTKPVHKACANCAHMTFIFGLPESWMQREETKRPGTWAQYKKPTHFQCSLEGLNFAVTKSARCNAHTPGEPKEREA